MYRIYLQIQEQSNIYLEKLIVCMNAPTKTIFWYTTRKVMLLFGSI